MEASPERRLGHLQESVLLEQGKLLPGPRTDGVYGASGRRNRHDLDRRARRTLHRGERCEEHRDHRAVLEHAHGSRRNGIRRRVNGARGREAPDEPAVRIENGDAPQADVRRRKGIRWSGGQPLETPEFPRAIACPAPRGDVSPSGVEYDDLIPASVHDGDTTVRQQLHIPEVGKDVRIVVFATPNDEVGLASQSVSLREHVRRRAELDDPHAGAVEDGGGRGIRYQLGVGAVVRAGRYEGEHGRGEEQTSSH